MTIEGLLVGSKVTVYTVVMRAGAQSSYAGTVSAVSELGVTVEAASGRMFFPWNAVERMAY